MRLFTLFPNLITKESYNWWVTRRFWEFRHKISTAKYLKISQNIGGKYQEASGEHRSTVQNGCSPIQVDAIRWSGYVRPEKLKRSPFLSGVRIPDVDIQGKWRQLGANWRRTSGCNSYLDMWFGRPPMVYPDALSGYTPCMYSKELSSISYCFGDKKAIKTPKLNTFLIRNDCKGP